MGLSDDDIPEEMNFGPNNMNNFFKNQDNVYIYGFLPNRSFNEKYILDNLKRNFSTGEWNNSKFFYHGTNWKGAKSIVLDGIETLQDSQILGKYFLCC